MTLRKRPVDRAMAEERKEKKTIRSLWISEVEAAAEEHPDSTEPWYLTLSGAEGLDVELIIKKRLIKLTEVNSISEEDKHRIVAVEQNIQAVAALQKKFVGLRIKQVDFRNLVRGEGPFSWPDGEDEICCRAHVVNLDLNAPLRADRSAGQVVFPIPTWIQKLCQLHSKAPRIDWTLCLTLHAEVVWPEEVNHWTKQFLLENFRREPRFAKSCEDFFGPDLYRLIMTNDEVDFTQLERVDQQKFIMVMVPKFVARLVHDQGWRVHTERCLRYGYEENAPMVTWIVRFTWDATAQATPDVLYRDALCNILSGAGIINIDGSITKFQA